MTTTIVLAVIGLGVLVVGADMLVRGASRLAAAFGIPPLVIGLTVVGFATSSPELAVSVQAALAGEGDIAVGNVVGSNIFNVLFILGLSALVAPLAVSRQLIRLDVPVMIAASVFFYAIAMNGLVGPLGGLLMVAMMAAYLAFQVWWTLRRSRPEQPAAAAVVASRQPSSLARNTAMVAAGLVLLILGADWLVDGAVALARVLGVSELVIALTLVAAGTGMPEAATSVMATVRGERDIAVGNVVGSNVFNLLLVMGLSGIVAPGGLRITQDALAFDVPVMVVTAFACLPVFFTGRTIARWEGGIFLIYYVCYTLYLLLAAAQHDALPTFSTVMLAFVLPLTVITFIAVSRHERLRQPKAA